MPESHAPEESGTNMNTPLVQTLILTDSKETAICGDEVIQSWSIFRVGERCQVGFEHPDVSWVYGENGVSCSAFSFIPRDELNLEG